MHHLCKKKVFFHFNFFRNSSTLHGNVVGGSNVVESQPNPTNFATLDIFKPHPEFKKTIQQVVEKMFERDEKRDEYYSPRKKHDHRQQERHEYEHHRHRRRENDHDRSDRHKSDHSQPAHTAHSRQNTWFDEDIEQKKRKHSNGHHSRHGSKIPDPSGMFTTICSFRIFIHTKDRKMPNQLNINH